MENKYYTPDISEFYVGFEYEHCHSSVRFVMLNFKTGDTSNIGEPKEIWEKSIFSGREYDIWKSSFKFDDSLKNGQIRVKYLDKEDIESLGFEHDQSTKDGSYFYSGTLMTENQWCINLKDFIVDIYDINGKSDFRFNGFVKNKSELKQILKMIGYESEQRD